ncbi:polyprenyl synthetase family protein [Paenibacillus yanchengensis]|uniref:Polyprenyl synthetase family protein n=1 Tax=Paenibacillus yanchengensis TaxID=2035833 RepID=A0ABW4YP24_9BACL
MLSKQPLYEQLHLSLEEINEMLLNIIRSDQELDHTSELYYSIERMIAAGGKRLRPIMTLIGGRFGNPERIHLVWKAAGLLEYMHMASLVHDDVIDESELRRGEQALHAVTDIETAVHAGNYMIARALEWCSDEELLEEDFFTGAELAALITELCVGEYNQLQHRFDFDMTFEQYLEKTKRKTALLMGACMSAGAKAAGAAEEVAQKLYEFGESLGIAFQIYDDLLDFTSKSEEIGKPAGADLRSGQLTLPVLYALDDEKQAVVLRELHEASQEEDFAIAVQMIEQSDALERSRQTAQQYVEQAEHCASYFADHPHYCDLQVLVQYFAHAAKPKQ